MYHRLDLIAHINLWSVDRVVFIEGQLQHFPYEVSVKIVLCFKTYFSM